jgi:DNA-binding MarR family transcriptional regulator
MRKSSCFCIGMRQAAQSITQLYDDVLAPSGLKVTQFSILRVVQRSGPMSISGLAQQVDLDRTTIGRNLQVLVRDAMVALSPGEDRRERSVHLTARGEQALAIALPLWEKAQAIVTSSLGDERLTRLTDLLAVLSATIVQSL